MALTAKGEATKRRILSACAKLFLEKGYKKTTVADITSAAKVSNSSFQHYFVAKDGVLAELSKPLFALQLKTVSKAIGDELPPMGVYAMEACIQMTLAELNESLREIYLQMYGHIGAACSIQESRGRMAYQAFGAYQPGLCEEDFRAFELGALGLMRGYMACACDERLELEDMHAGYLRSVLRIYGVPEEEIRSMISFVEGLEVRALAQGIMGELFAAFALHYGFGSSGEHIESDQGRPALMCPA